MKRNDQATVRNGDSSYSSGNEVSRLHLSGNDTYTSENGQHFRENYQHTPDGPRNYPLTDISSPMTIGRTKKMKEALNTLIEDTYVEEMTNTLHYSPHFVNVFQVDDIRPNVHSPH